jgi:hypothetical protein
LFQYRGNIDCAEEHFEVIGQTTGIAIPKSSSLFIEILIPLPSTQAISREP